MGGEPISSDKRELNNAVHFWTPLSDFGRDTESLERFFARGRLLIARTCVRACNGTAHA
jgi:hypothetical protein